MNPFTVLIPARLASTRLPGKPLADIGGKPMVVRVAERARKSGAAQVVVAADAPEITAACAAHGVTALLTRPGHPSGSDRLAEACALLGLPDDACVVNVQGDEPLIDPALIDAVAARLVTCPGAAMSTAAHAIVNAAEFANPNVVKVVLDAQQMALYFSRAPIAWWRDGFARGLHATTALPGSARAAEVAATVPGRWCASPDESALAAPLRHIGIYAYRASFLRQFPTLAPAPIEQTESLEQLRALWHGYRIAVHLTPDAPGPGIDTPEDLERIRHIWQESL